MAIKLKANKEFTQITFNGNEIALIRVFTRDNLIYFSVVVGDTNITQIIADIVDASAQGAEFFDDGSVKTMN